MQEEYVKAKVSVEEKWGIVLGYTQRMKRLHMQVRVYN